MCLRSVLLGEAGTGHYAMSDLTKPIAADWREHSYYSRAERWLDEFWKDGTIFRFYFDQLDTDRTLELACGHGRHAALIVEKVGHLTLVDVNEENIVRCRSRFSRHSNITYVTNNGADLRDVPSGSQTAAFCYDSMVHFEAEVVIGYLGELARILARGGRAVLHYSNMHWMLDSKYGDGPHMRNFFSAEMMTHFSQRVGFRLIGHSTLDWGANPIWRNLDGLVLLEKVARCDLDQ
jgi:ubiquinone/menaquinone biosynthesis C-methylase UbiE